MNNSAVATQTSEPRLVDSTGCPRGLVSKASLCFERSDRSFAKQIGKISDSKFGRAARIASKVLDIKMQPLALVSPPVAGVLRNKALLSTVGLQGIKTF